MLNLLAKDGRVSQMLKTDEDSHKTLSKIFCIAGNWRRGGGASSLICGKA